MSPRLQPASWCFIPLLPRWAEQDWVNINTRQEEDKSLSFRKKVKKIQEELEATDEAQRK